MTSSNATRGVGRRAMMTGVGGILVAPAIARAQGAGGVALVVGNSKYRWESSLPNVKRDAPDIAKRLQALGVKTELLMDVDRGKMLGAIDKLGAAAKGANFAAFYFAGHGVSSGYDSFLVPEDADLGDPKAMDRLVNSKQIADTIGAASHSLLVCDSCRNNPADGWRQLEATRTAVIRNPQQLMANTPPNRLVMFSTAPGHVALDGPPGQNSPFAAALLRELGGGSVDIAALPEKLRRTLLLDTQGKQLMFDINSYKQPFMLGGGAVARSDATAASAISLPNIYAFAQSNDIPLPPGLVAIRSGSQKVGAYKYEGRGDGGRYPEILIVISDEQGAAYGILAAKTPKMRYWRFIRATVSGEKLDFRPSSTSAHFTFEWRDANSGSVGVVWQNDAQARPHSARFTRVD